MLTSSRGPHCATPLCFPALQQAWWHELLQGCRPARPSGRPSSCHGLATVFEVPPGVYQKLPHVSACVRTQACCWTLCSSRHLCIMALWQALADRPVSCTTAPGARHAAFGCGKNCLIFALTRLNNVCFQILGEGGCVGLPLEWLLVAVRPFCPAGLHTCFTTSSCDLTWQSTHVFRFSYFSAHACMHARMCLCCMRPSGCGGHAHAQDCS